MDSRRRPVPRGRRTIETGTQQAPNRPQQTPRQTPRQMPSSQPPKQNRTTVTGKKKKPPVMARIGAVILKVLAFVLATVLFLTVVVAGSLKMICSDANPSAQSTFVTTILETGKLKFLANMFASKTTIQRIIDSNKMAELNDEIDSSLISIPNGDQSGTGDPEEKDIEVIDIPGPTYKGTLLIVKDPARVSVATIYPWREAGETLDTIAENAGAIAAINGGLYNSYVNKGGQPYGVVVSNGEIQYNAPQDFAGLVLIGFTEDNILQIIDINGWGPTEVENLVAEQHIRDAVTFQEESTDANNHFVQLIINGEPRNLNGGTGGGLNPRTVIGQRADGAILMLVTDGRGKNNHLGASASDLIDIMQKYGAVNAANLDGGSSSCMYYDHQYLMTSVTFYYTNSSWNLPLAFVVK